MCLIHTYHIKVELDRIIIYKHPLMPFLFPSPSISKILSDWAYLALHDPALHNLPNLLHPYHTPCCSSNMPNTLSYTLFSPVILYYTIHTILYLVLYFHNIYRQLFQMSFLILCNYLVFHRWMNRSLLISPLMTGINTASVVLHVYESVCRMNSLK